MKKQMNSPKGITLIALVLTIIILIVLAGISINLITGEKGIIERTKQAKEKYELAQIAEELEVKKVDTKVNNFETTIQEYIEQIQKPGELSFSLDDISIEDENNAYITVKGEYNFLLEHEQNGNIKITYQGKISELLPRIKEVKISDITSTAMKVNVQAERATSYKYYIKEKTQTEYILKQETENINFTFTNLKFNTEYDVKVEAVNNIGTIKNEINDKTAEVTLSDLKGGDYVKYNTGVTAIGTNGIINCRVLYEKDNVKGYGLQIISDQSLESLNLNGKTAYNNAIATLNNITAKYKNTAYATDARCVGTNPLNKNAENTSSVNVNGINTGCKGPDSNYVEDYNRLQELSMLYNTFFLGSRECTNVGGDIYHISMRYVTGGKIDSINGNIVNVMGRSVYDCSHGSGILGCFKLREDLKILSGDGKTAETAYALSTK